MKAEIHPEYRYVVFEDASCGFRFLTRSTMQSKKTTKWDDGEEYPLVTIDISSQSHPYYTGKARLLDAAGRVEKFNKKFGGFASALTSGKKAAQKADGKKADGKKADAKKADKSADEPKPEEAEADQAEQTDDADNADQAQKSE